jgi:hypothetical protein
MEQRLAIAEHNVITERQYVRELKGAMNALRVVADWFDVLKRSEVMVLTPEGMKYLVGQDLEDFCKAEIDKQNSNKIWWDEIGTSAFIKPANTYLNELIRDEADRIANDQLDAYIYTTKGKSDDAGSKSKKESS